MLATTREGLSHAGKDANAPRVTTMRRSDTQVGKRLHTMLGQVARAKAELENATRGIKSQLTAQLGAEPERSPTDSSHESVVSE
jgi:hypothetical protein